MVATEPWSQAIVVSLVLMEMCHSVSFCYLRHAHFVSHVSTYAVVKLPQQSRGGPRHCGIQQVASHWWLLVFDLFHDKLSSALAWSCLL